MPSKWNRKWKVHSFPNCPQIISPLSQFLSMITSMQTIALFRAAEFHDFNSWWSGSSLLGTGCPSDSSSIWDCGALIHFGRTNFGDVSTSSFRPLVLSLASIGARIPFGHQIETLSTISKVLLTEWDGRTMIASIGIFFRSIWCKIKEGSGRMMTIFDQ